MQMVIDAAAMEPAAAGADGDGSPRRGIAAAMPGPGRFNFFQRMMLRWRELHPYNPVHVLRIPAPLDAGRLREAIAAQLEAQCLTGLCVDARRWRFEFEGGPAQVELRVLDGAGAADAVLSRCIEEELNRPFAAGVHENPFRFVAIDEHGAFRLALVYDHYVAGGEAIARWLTQLAGQLLGEVALPAPAQACGPGRYRQAVLRHPGWWLRALVGVPRMLAQSRRSCRMRSRGADDRRNGFRSLQLGAAQTRALQAAAGAWGVTLHELVTACLLKALSPVVPGRDERSRRNALAVASIMNMRRDLGPASRDGISPFLAAYRVVHRVPEGIGLRQLALEVHAQVQRVKRDHLYLQSLMGLALTVPLWPLLTPRQRDAFYPKHFPVQAGITTIDLDRLWAERGGAPSARIDYLRAVPTGPLCPLVLAVTRVRGELRLGLCFRTGVYSGKAVERLTRELQQCFDALPPQAEA